VGLKGSPVLQREHLNWDRHQPEQGVAAAEVVHSAPFLEQETKCNYSGISAFVR